MPAPVENPESAAPRISATKPFAGGFGRQVVRAGLWSSAARIVGEGARYVIAIVLARILSPEEFGLIALATALMSLVQAFADLRISYALIQRPHVTEEEWSTVFWLYLGLGSVLTFAFAAAAGTAASFYASPALREIVGVLSLSFLLSAVSMVPRTRLEKELRFKALSLAQVPATVTTGVIAVAMALAGFGVWSLVAQSLAMYVLEAVFAFAITRWRPRFTFRPAALRPLLTFGGPLVLHDVLNTLSQAADRLILGKTVGAADLGLYNRAKIFMYLPVSNLSYSLTRVMFPSLSVLQDDPERLQRAALRMLKLLAIVSFPLMTVTAALAEPLVRVVLGTKWLAAVPMMQIFALAGVCACINAVTTTIFLAKGKTGTVLRLGAIKQALAVAGAAIGSVWGASGCATGVLAVAFVTFALDAHYVSRHLEARTHAYYRNLIPPFAVALMTGGSVWLVAQASELAARPFLLLAIALPAATVLYGMLLTLVDREGLSEVINLIRQSVRRQSPASPIAVEEIA